MAGHGGEFRGARGADRADGDIPRVLDRAAIDAAATHSITFKVGKREFTMTGGDYVTGWMLPNFYFHVTTAYAILRHNGLGLGKIDFLGAVPAKIG